MMKRSLLFAAILLISILQLSADETLAERELRSLVEEGKRILNNTRRADGSYDEQALERRFQSLIHKYDAFIHEHDDFPVGYVAYGQVLEQIGQNKAARTMYLKANQLDPNIPLVKNQLGNFLVEEEDFAGALPYYLAAIELAPKEPIYHYQLGTLLHEFRDSFLEEEIFDRPTLDEKMLKAFETAAELAPAETAFTYRHAEAFYDLEKPRWKEAMEAWSKIEKKVSPGVEKETIYLHRANILLKQEKPAEARKLLARVKQPALARNKEKLLKQLPAEESAASEKKIH